MNVRSIANLSGVALIAFLQGSVGGAQDVHRAPPSIKDAPKIWTVDTRPRLRIAPNDTLEFGVIVHLSVLANGGVVLASDVANSIQFFDAKGRRTKLVGRSGQGPGEFRGVDQFHRFSDTLVLVDRRGITQMFSLAGNVIRTEARIPTSLRRVGYFANGDRITVSTKTDHLAPDRWGQSQEEVTRQSGPNSTSLGVFPSYQAIRYAGGKVDGKIYGPRNRVAVLTRSFCAGYNGAFTFACFDENGKQISKISRPDVRLKRVTNDDREAYFDSILEANKTSPDISSHIKLLRTRVQFSETFPAFGRMLASRDDLIWIGPPSVEDFILHDPNTIPVEPTLWSVYSPQGAWISSVTLPARFRLLEAGADYVAGVSKDTDENDVVIVYSLRRR